MGAGIHCIITSSITLLALAFFHSFFGLGMRILFDNRIEFSLRAYCSQIFINFKFEQQFFTFHVVNMPRWTWVTSITRWQLFSPCSLTENFGYCMTYVSNVKLTLDSCGALSIELIVPASRSSMYGT